MFTFCIEHMAAATAPRSVAGMLPWCWHVAIVTARGLTGSIPFFQWETNVILGEYIYAIYIWSLLDSSRLYNVDILYDFRFVYNIRF